MELGPTTFLLLIILFAIGTAVMLITMGKWLDLTGVRYKMDTQRNAMNLIQLIVSNSPIVSVDGQPKKIILDANELDNYEMDASIGDENPSDRRKEWEECCDFLNFDNNFTVHDVVTDREWTIGNLFFKVNSDCYPDRKSGFADLPVVISTGSENHHGSAVLELMQTPLSDLSFWLSHSFMRAHWDDYWELFPEEKTYSVNIPLDPEIIEVSIDETNQRICTHVDKNGDGNEDIVICKNFVYKDKTLSGSDITFTKMPYYNTDECMYSTIIVTQDPRDVTITYPV